MFVKCIPPETPLLYRKNVVCRGITYLIFGPKHALWVLGEAVLTCIHSLSFEPRFEKCRNFLMKIFIFFLTFDKFLYIAWACFRKGVGLWF